MNDVERMVAELAARPEGVDEAEYAEREAESLRGWESTRNLSHIRSYAMSVPRPRGFDLVLTGDAARGWPEVERWWVLETLTTHLIGAHMASGAQVLLGYALTVGETRPAEWMAAALQARMKLYPDAYEGQHFPRFMLHLHRAYTPDAKAGPGAIPELGPYAAIFAAWDDADALAAALADVCTHRVVEVVAAERADVVSEFRFAPLLPVEVTAVQRIRADRGELPVAVEHPLLRTPLAAIPTTRSYDPSTDPWYQRVVELGTTSVLKPDFHW
jgi:hypothetical protein